MVFLLFLKYPFKSDFKNIDKILTSNKENRKVEETLHKY